MVVASALRMAKDFGSSSPSTTCRKVTTPKPTPMETEEMTVSLVIPSFHMRGWITRATYGSPTMPSAMLASVMPSCVAER